MAPFGLCITFWQCVEAHIRLSDWQQICNKEEKMYVEDVSSKHTAATGDSLRSSSDLQDEVLIAGFGRRGHAVGDIPGVRFKVSLPAVKEQAVLATSP